ncbi:hypothetical protein K438DRAFT_1789865 [Mycena galopus ATCC 62051]|nr:hypothetical protein K438DRAFT_1789865 [Mycena galopus ATCC 62051]
MSRTRSTCAYCLAALRGETRSPPRAYRLHLLSWRDEARTNKRPSNAEVALSAQMHLPSQAVRTVKSASASPPCGAAARGVVRVVMAGIIAVRSSLLLLASYSFNAPRSTASSSSSPPTSRSISMSLAQGCVELGAGFVIGLAAGFAIAIVGGTAQQPRLSVGMASRPFSLHLPLRRAHRRSAGRQHGSHVTLLASRNPGAQGRMFRVSRRRIGHGRAGYWRGWCGRDAGQCGRAACELPVGQWREREDARPRGQEQW